MARVFALVVTQFAKPLLSESLRSVDRSMQLDYGSAATHKLVLVLFQELFGIDGGGFARHIDLHNDAAHRVELGRL